MDRRLACMVVSGTVGLLAQGACATLYELRIEGTVLAFAGFPAASLVNRIVYDTDTVPVTNVSLNVTTSRYAVQSYSLQIDGVDFSLTNTPEIMITDVEPGPFGNPDQFIIDGTFDQVFAGVRVTRLATYAFDYGLDAIHDTALPTHESYFQAFGGGHGGLIAQIDFIPAGGGNFVTEVTDQRVTITPIPVPGVGAIVGVCVLLGARRRR